MNRENVVFNIILIVLLLVIGGLIVFAFQYPWESNYAPSPSVTPSVTNSPITNPGSTPVPINPTPNDPNLPPARAVMTGTYECLPPRNPNLPHTLECAFGMKSDNGFYYALSMSNVSQNDIMDIQTGERVRVEGTLVPIEQISSDMWQKYNIKGIVAVTSIIKIK